MTTDRDLIVYIVDRFEKGRVSNPASDRDGPLPTRWGVTADDIAEFHGIPLAQVTAADIVDLTRDQAVTILLSLFVARPGFGKILDWRLKLATVNFGILSGRTPAARALQKAAGVVQDGICGNATITAVNASNPALLRETVIAEHLRRLGHLVTAADAKLWAEVRKAVGMKLPATVDPAVGEVLAAIGATLGKAQSANAEGWLNRMATVLTERELVA